MRRECEATIKPGQAFLIVTYGNANRKHCPLESDLVVLGRAPTCDISLVSPEVAPVHCIFQRAATGWRIRDCSGGRHATRLNGRPVHDEPVHDTDVLQISTFTFEVRLPSGRPTPVPERTPVVDERVARRLKRLQHSRRNLIRLALRFRSKASRAQALPPTLAELERQAQCLRGLQQDYEILVEEYEKRLAEMERAEREVCDERAAFEIECTERQAQLDKSEHDMMRRQAEMEKQLKQRWEECQQRCYEAEQAHARLLQAVPVSSEGAVSASQEWALVLDRRSQELSSFARHLRRWRQQLLEVKLPENHVCAEDAWQQKFEQIQAESAAREARLQQQSAQLQAEHARIREEADTLSSQVKELQGITDSLTRELQDRESALQTLRRQLEQHTAQTNVENSGGYERELNAFRLELERDRQELNEQIYQLQTRQAEIEAAARETELQMSRERAVLARERAELTRLREDIRISRDRSSREGEIRERLASLQSLKQVITGLSPSAPGDKPRLSAELVTEAEHPERESVG